MNEHHWERILTRGAKALAIALLASGCAYTARVSVGPNGTQGDSFSYSPAVSRDGRFVAFSSLATNLLPAGVDTNGAGDVFVRDLALGTTARVSVATGGAETSGGAGLPAINDDGRYVAFSSTAANLVAGDTNAQLDVFVHDRNTTTTTRVSVATGGGEGNSASWRQQISADGRYVTFDSLATNLVPGDTNGANDVFVHDRTTGVTERVSLNSSEQQAGAGCWSAWPSISDDGRFVAFRSSPCAWGLPSVTVGSNIWLRDRTNGTTQIIAGGNSGGSPFFHDSPAVSGDGRFVLFTSNQSTVVAGDTNNAYDVFVFDRTTSTYALVSLGVGGVQGNASVGSPATISDDGRWVAFSSDATNLVPGDTNGVHDAFVRDRFTSRTFRVSTDILLAQGNSLSFDTQISGDGKYVVYGSEASNLVGADTNVQGDVFLQVTNRPAVSFITPGAVVVGFSGPVMIAGTGFEPGASVAASTAKVTFSNVVVVNEQTITATMTVAADAPKVSHNVAVANPGGTWQPAAGAAAQCIGCLTLR